MAKHEKKKTDKKTPMTLIISLSVVLVCVAALFGTYYFTINKSDTKYIKALNAVKVKIDQINKQASDALPLIEGAETTKDMTKINEFKNVIKTCESDFSEVTKAMQDITPTQKYGAQFQNYSLGVDANKKIFAQISLILNNLNSSDMDKALEALNTYITKAKTHYAASELKRIKITLPTGIEKINLEIGNYTSSYQTDYSNKVLESEQYVAYFEAMDKVVYNFNNLKSNLNQNYTLLENNAITFNNVYTAIENKFESLADIGKDYYKIRVPEKVADLHNKFDLYFNRYYDYCTDFKETIGAYEEVESGSDEAKVIKEQFKDINKKYNDITKAFNDFVEEYNTAKHFYCDPNNL